MHLHSAEHSLGTPGSYRHILLLNLFRVTMCTPLVISNEKKKTLEPDGVVSALSGVLSSVSPGWVLSALAPALPCVLSSVAPPGALG